MSGEPRFQSPWLHVLLLVGTVLLVTGPATRACASVRPSHQLSRAPVAAQGSRQRAPAAKRPQKPAPGAVVVTGRERIEWDQEGPSFDEINRYHYVAVVGLMRREMADVKCRARGAKGPFVCSGVLPPLDQGNHQVRVLALRRDGGRELAGPWSRPLLLFKQ